MHDIGRSGKDKKKLADRIFEEFESNIRQGLLKEGERIPAESVLVHAYGVSRSVVREAMSQLQAARLVVTRHGVGTFVNGEDGGEESPHLFTGKDLESVADVVAVMDYRLALESESVALAALRRTGEQLDAIALAHRRYGESLETPGQTIAFDIDFHLAIATASGNKYLIEALNRLVPKFIPRQRIGSVHQPQQDPNFLARIDREHEAIFHAIVSQQPEDARAALRIHLNNSRERVLLRRTRPALER